MVKLIIITGVKEFVKRENAEKKALMIIYFPLMRNDSFILLEEHFQALVILRSENNKLISFLI